MFSYLLSVLIVVIVIFGLLVAFSLFNDKFDKKHKKRNISEEFVGTTMQDNYCSLLGNKSDNELISPEECLSSNCCALKNKTDHVDGINNLNNSIGEFTVF
jgi:hypothetical protein